VLHFTLELTRYRSTNASRSSSRVVMLSRLKIRRRRRSLQE
jgi:hypothetical protein